MSDTLQDATLEPGEQETLDKIRGAMYPKQVQAETQTRAPDGKFTKPEAAEAQKAPETPEAPEGEPEHVPAEPVVEGAESPEEDLTWENVRNVKLKIPMKNGDEEWEEELSLEDLRLGHLRQADYQRKTQEIASQRTKAQEEVRQAAHTLRQQAIAELSTYEQALFNLVAPQFQNVDMNRLAAENPAEWAQMRQTQEHFNAVLYALRSNRQQLEQAHQAEDQSKRAQAVQQAQEELTKHIPNWGPELDQALAKMATSEYGFRPDELAQGTVSIADARVMRLAHDAYQWRQLQAQKPIATKKVAEAPKVLKPGAKRDPKEGLRRRSAELMEQVRKTGGAGVEGEAALAAALRQRMFGR
jgi:hypothetical protein